MAADTIVQFSIFFKVFEETDLDEELIAKKQVELMKLATEITKEYIWQREKFSVCKEKSINNTANFAVLKGSLNCGENIEDEWFVVYTLFRMSKEDENILISITDDDGQFLLIEAADHIPRWLNPDTAENRVFIHKGKLHVIPLPSNPSQIALFPTGKPSIQKAVDIILGGHNTEASEKIQSSIAARIERFENGFTHLLHNAYCFVPQTLAYILQKDPSIANRILETLERFLTERSFGKQKEKLGLLKFEDCVITRVCFSRYTYAKLLHIDVKEDVTLMSTKGEEKSLSQKSCSLGKKLALGFHLLCKEIDLTKMTLKGMKNFEEEEWASFKASLEKFGYFKGEIEGSKKWQELHEKAKHYFQAELPTENEKKNWDFKQILSLIEESKAKNFNAENIPPEDSDSWLDLSVDEVEQLLHRGATTAENASSKLEDVVKGMQTFVQKSSDFEGVETEKDLVEFDASAIFEELQRIADGKSKIDSDDDISDDFDEEELADDSDSSDIEAEGNISSIMEEELSRTTMARSFRSNAEDKAAENPDDVTEDQPLDIDFNLVKNFLESFSAQQGAAGPVSNILNSMGISLPPDDPSIS